MTRQELMEKMYKENPCVDAGTITIALAKRFPRWQGNYNVMARHFLMEKKRAKLASKNPRDDFDKFMSEAMRFANRLAENLRGERWEFAV